MAPPISLRCRCGASHGELDVDARSAMHLVCYCDDCRAFAHAIDRADILDANGGTEVFITPFSRFKLGAGSEHVRCLRLSQNGMFRWYWGCCNTPLANTQSSAGAPMVSVHGACIAQGDTSLPGPTRRVMARHATGAPPAGAEKGISFSTLLKIVWLVLKTLVRGAGKPNPLVRDGQPLAEPRVLTSAERDALR